MALCPFGRMVVGLPLEPMLSDHGQSARHVCGVDFRYNQKAVGSLHNMCAPIAPTGISCCLVVIVPQGDHRWIMTLFLGYQDLDLK